MKGKGEVPSPPPRPTTRHLPLSTRGAEGKPLHRLTAVPLSPLRVGCKAPVALVLHRPNRQVRTALNGLRRRPAPLSGEVKGKGQGPTTSSVMLTHDSCLRFASGAVCRWHTFSTDRNEVKTGSHMMRQESHGFLRSLTPQGEAEGKPLHHATHGPPPAFRGGEKDKGKGRHLISHADA